ncbi:ABC transporter permease subunit [Chitinasiproducens palmae]|uniref:Dipeptide transport system permease protein n=1 Tax=Chitinasiproducens palmae TaxID=1770053 RepID=A0A1H2PTA9_9BURK|nr:ABC transporter permease subunit [Chitinasiproducens palmae]SDV50320.1 dipeptide transport system permease protein [Chitinasiproducens palmae]
MSGPVSLPARATPSSRRLAWQGFWRQFRANRGALCAAVVVLLLVAAALAAPLLAPHDPVAQFRDAVRVPPAWQSGGSLRFVLGTDEAGRDILSRLIHGARLSLLIGLVSVALSMVPGILLGLLAAFFPRWLDAPVSRLMDVLLALPSLLLAVAVVAVLGPGLLNTMLAIGIVGLPGYTRLARAAATGELQKDYVVASRVAGAGTARLMFSQVLPNCAAPLIVQATLGFSTAILDAAALGFLGLGVQPPRAEWGAMLASARDYIESAWWIVTMPGLAILITVLAINLLGDGLRDALDPRLKRVDA